MDPNIALGLELLAILLKYAPDVVKALKDSDHPLAPQVEEIMASGNASRKLLE